MLQRTYALVIAVLAVAAIVLTWLPWAGSGPMGLSLSWNGFGTADYDQPSAAPVPLDELSATALGTFVVIAAVVALLAAVATAAPPLAGLATPLRWVAALFTLGAAVVPVVVIVSPQVFLGPAFDAVGARELLDDPHYRDLLRDQILRLPTLIALAAVLVVTAAVCVAAAITARLIRSDPPPLQPDLPLGSQ